MDLTDAIKTELKEAMYAAQAGRLITLKDKKYELSSLGEAKVGDKTVVGVKINQHGLF